MKGYECDQCEEFTTRALTVSRAPELLSSGELHFCSWRCLRARAGDSRGVPLDDEWARPLTELLDMFSEPFVEDGEITVPAVVPHGFVLSDEDLSTCAECGEKDGHFIHRLDLRMTTSGASA